MKKVIYVVVTPGYQPEMCAQTIPRIEKYAHKIGGTLHIISERKWPHLPVSYEKFQVYELSKDNDWSILLDADMIIDDDMYDVTEHVRRDHVGFWHTYDPAGVYPIDKYFFRDGRRIGVTSNFLVVPRACHDIFTPLEDPESVIPQLQRPFILDDYNFSRNLARFGLKFMSILKQPGVEHFRHLNVTTGLTDIEEDQDRAKKRPGYENEKRAVVTMAPNDSLKSIAAITHPKMIEFAKAAKAEFVILDDETGVFQIRELLNQFDQVLFLNTECLVRTDSPDIFNSVPLHEMGMCFDKSPELEKMIRETWVAMKMASPCNPPFYDISVMVVSRAHQKFFEPLVVPFNELPLSVQLNIQIIANGIPVRELSWRYNRHIRYDNEGYPPRTQAYINQYSGHDNEPEVIVEMMKRDNEVFTAKK